MSTILTDSSMCVNVLDMNEAKRLEMVEWGARGVANANESLVLAVRKAVKAGISLRKIAAAAGRSHEWVRNIAEGDD
jgi:hypothetical protein